MIWLPLDRQSSVPLSKQVVQGIRNPILEGKLAAGDKLPSTRELAAELGVSRNVIVEAYDMLLCEGFLEGKPGSGTYVAAGAELAGYGNIAATVESGKDSEGTDVADDSGMIEFRTGLPALDHFPRARWGELLKEAYRDMSELELGYGPTAGLYSLRTVLSRYLIRMRGVSARPEQIVITTGAVQGVQLASRLLLDSQSSIAVEDPSNVELQYMLGSTGARLIPVPVDESGLCTNLLPADEYPSCIYVTPSHQFPYGGYLPIQRRIELIQYARAKGCMILEDDYDSEFRYEGASIHSLHSLEPEQVIYIGTFSKLLAPSLRLGYMVLPPWMVEPICKLKRAADYQSPTAEQWVLSRYISEGGLDTHINRMKKLYRKRQQALLGSLAHYFPGQHRIFGASTGLHVVVSFGFPITNEMWQKLDEQKVRLTPVRSHAMLPREMEGHFLLGYGHLEEEQIREGIRRISCAFGEISAE